jgi:hypothetical protein
MTLKTITTAIALLGLAVAAAQAGGPAEHDEGTAQAKPTANTAEQTLQGRRAVRDSVTGKLRAPTPEEEAAMSAARKSRSQSARSAPVAPMIVRQHSGGMRSAVLGPEYLSTLKAERQSDGKLVVRHANPAHEHSSAAQPNTTTRTNE